MHILSKGRWGYMCVDKLNHVIRLRGRLSASPKCLRMVACRQTGGRCLQKLATACKNNAYNYVTNKWNKIKVWWTDVAALLFWFDIQTESTFICTCSAPICRFRVLLVASAVFFLFFEIRKFYEHTKCWLKLMMQLIPPTHQYIKVNVPCQGWNRFIKLFLTCKRTSSREKYKMHWLVLYITHENMLSNQTLSRYQT